MTSSDIVAKELQEIIKTDDFHALKKLISSESGEVRPSYRDYYGRSLMYMAAARGSNGCIKTLVDAGANVNDRVPGYGNVPDMQPRTPLNRSIASGKLASAELLLTLGANPSIPDHDGRTALHHAALKACSAQVARVPKQIVDYVDLIEKLVSSGCAVDQRDFKGFTPLLSVIHEAPNHPPNIIEALLAHGADIKATADGMIQVIHRPWKSGDEPLMQLLAKSGADLGALDVRGRTALMYAQDIVAVQALIDLGADPNQPDLDGRNMLHRLIANKNAAANSSPVLLQLVEIGVSARQADFSGRTAFDYLEQPERDRHPEADALRMGILAYEARSKLRFKLPNRSSTP